MAKTDTNSTVENYPVKLTWKQIWAAAVIAAGIIGSIFTAGMKVQNEVNKVELAKLAQKNLDDLAYLKASLSRQLMETNESLVFYKNQYRVTKERLATCIEKGTYIENTQTGE